MMKFLLLKVEGGGRQRVKFQRCEMLWCRYLSLANTFFANMFAAITLCGLFHMIWYEDGILMKVKMQKPEGNNKIHKSEQKTKAV